MLRCRGALVASVALRVRDPMEIVLEYPAFGPTRACRRGELKQKQNPTELPLFPTEWRLIEYRGLTHERIAPERW